MSDMSPWTNTAPTQGQKVRIPTGVIDVEYESIWQEIRTNIRDRLNDLKSELTKLLTSFSDVLGDYAEPFGENIRLETEDLLTELDEIEFPELPEISFLAPEDEAESKPETEKAVPSMSLPEPPQTEQLSGYDFGNYETVRVSLGDIAVSLDDLVDRFNLLRKRIPEILFPEAPVTADIEIPDMKKDFSDLLRNIPAPPVFVWSDLQDCQKSETGVIEQIRTVLANKGMMPSENESSAVFDRTVSRADEQFSQKYDAVNAEMSASGWNIPTGFMQSALWKIRTDRQMFINQELRKGTENNIGISRNVYLDAMKSGVTLEQTMREAFKSVADRWLNYKVLLSEYAVQSYLMILDYLKLKTETIRIQLETYLTELEFGAKKTDVWFKKVQAELLKKRLTLAQTEVLSTVLDAYRTALSAFEARIQAKADELSVQEAQIEDAKTRADAKLQKEKLKVQENELAVQIKGAEIQKALSGFDADTQMLVTEMEINRFLVSEYTERLRGTVRHMQAIAGNLEAMVYKNQSKNSLKADTNAKALDVWMKTSQKWLEQAALVSQVFNQKMSSLYASLNISVGQSDGFTLGDSQSFGRSESVGYNVNIGESVTHNNLPAFTS